MLHYFLTWCARRNVHIDHGRHWEYFLSGSRPTFALLSRLEVLCVSYTCKAERDTLAKFSILVPR